MKKQTFFILSFRKNNRDKAFFSHPCAPLFSILSTKPGIGKTLDEHWYALASSNARRFVFIKASLILVLVTLVTVTKIM